MACRILGFSLWGVAISLLCSSCGATHGVNTHLYAPAREVSLCRVAVLPFVNESEEPLAAQIVSHIFLHRLVAHSPFETATEGAVRQFLLRHRILPANASEAGKNLYVRMGEELQVDTILRGKVLQCREEDVGADGMIPLLHLQVELVEAATGALISSSSHRRRGTDYRTMMHFGVIHTRTELIARTADEIIATWVEEGVKGCR
jgi:hypothetical protein